MNKFFYYFAWFGILSAIAMLLITIFWLLYPYKTNDFKEGDYTVDTKVVRSGEYVVFNLDRCKYTDVQPTISRSFVDGLVYLIPDAAGTISEKGCVHSKIYVHVPLALPPGKYHINTVYRWKMNPMRTIEQTKSTEQFEVIK